MSKSKLSKEYVSDSSDSEEEETFVPPKHFHELKPSSKSSFQPSSKQEIWLFKLPTNLNLKDVATLPISSDLSITTFTHKNTTYKITQELFLQDLNTSKYSIIAPSSKDSYKINNDSKIKRVFTISESIEIPKIDLAKVNIPRTDVPKEENLRMRHFPTGYGAKDYAELVLVDSVPSKKRKTDVVEVKEEKKLKKDKKEKKLKKEKKKKD